MGCDHRAAPSPAVELLAQSILKCQGPFARFENCHLLSSFWDAFFHEMTLQTSSPNQHCSEKQPR